jgi:hypothetical protein|tara:strand:+ start:267 stop:824 length:558 start_codon:yes stop_codon:yes gene_type:complete
MLNNVKILNSIIFIFVTTFLLNGCEDGWDPHVGINNIDELEISINPRLNKDDNGYYHLSLNNDKWQTLHRFSGEVLADSEPLDVFKVNWESSHYWYIGDTLGYIVKRQFSSYTGDYVYYDTLYVHHFDGMEVPTINPASYSNSDGEINTMFAPVKSMVGDTVKVWVYWFDYDYEEYRLSFEIVLD